MTDNIDNAIASPLAWMWRAAYPLLTLVALCWAGNSIVGRAVRDTIPPFTLAFVRWGGALLILLPFALPRLRQDAGTLRRHWRQTLMLGFIGIGMFNALLYTGLHYTTATNSLLVQSATPALILLLGLLIFRERVGAMRMAAVVLSMIGVAIVVTQGSFEVIRTLRLGLGDGLTLIAVFCWSLYSVLLRFRPPVHPLSFLAATFIIGTLLMGPLAVMEAWQGKRIVWSAAGLGAMAYVATLPSLFAYLLYNRGVELVGPARAGQFLNLMPLFGAGLAALLLGEKLGLHHLVGMVCILLGIVIFARAGAPSAQPSQTSSMR